MCSSPYRLHNCKFCIENVSIHKLSELIETDGLLTVECLQWIAQKARATITCSVYKCKKLHLKLSSSAFEYCLIVCMMCSFCQNNLTESVLSTAFIF